MSAVRRLPLLLALLPLAACGSSSLGKMPDSVVELYDQTDPAGGMEFELDRKGHLLEIEADVPIENVPQHLITAVHAQHPGAQLRGAEREINAHGEMWELKFISLGREYELVFDEDGEVHETEMSLMWPEVPPAVVAAADKALPESIPVSAELITQGKSKSYHIKKDKGGARYKIVLDERGEVVRLVREQRAEIEIPLPY